MTAETPMSPKRPASKKKAVTGNGMSSPKGRRAKVPSSGVSASGVSAASSGSSKRAKPSPKQNTRKTPRSLSPNGSRASSKRDVDSLRGGSLHTSNKKKVKSKSVQGPKSPKPTNKRYTSSSGIPVTPSPNPGSKQKVKMAKMPTPPLSAPADVSSRRMRPKVKLPYLNNDSDDESLDLEKPFASTRASKRNIDKKGASQGWKRMDFGASMASINSAKPSQRKLNDFNASMASVSSAKPSQRKLNDLNASMASINSAKSPKPSQRKLNASARLEVPLGNSPSSPPRKSNAKIATAYLSPPMSPKPSYGLDSSNHSKSRLQSMPSLDTSTHSKSGKQSMAAKNVDGQPRSSSASAIPSAKPGESLARQNKNKNKLQRAMMSYGNIGKSQNEMNRSGSNNRSFFGRKNTASTAAGSDKQQSQPENTVHAYSKTLVVIWTLVICELALDLVTTVISFIALISDDLCCGFKIEMGNLALGTTIPFLVLILLELGLLVYSIRLTLRSGRKPEEATQNSEDDPENPKGQNMRAIWSYLIPAGTGSAQDASSVFRAINVLVLLNPYFGCVVAWILLYQTSKAEAFSVLGLEGMSIILHWTSIYLEGRKQNRWSIALHLSPLIPFLVTCIVMLIFVWKEGVCYLVEETKFNFEGCRVCADKTLPAEISNGIQLETDRISIEDFNRKYVCADDSEPRPGEYCSSTTNFCFYAY